MPPYSDQQLTPVQRTIHDGLVMGARYSVVVSVNTSGGMSTSSRLFFVGKYIMNHMTAVWLSVMNVKVCSSDN